jgi:hypothetical protein
MVEELITYRFVAGIVNGLFEFVHSWPITRTYSLVPDTN